MFCFSIMLEDFFDLEIASGSQNTSKGTSLESSLKETYKIIVHSAIIICTFEKKNIVGQEFIEGSFAIF